MSASVLVLSATMARKLKPPPSSPQRLEPGEVQNRGSAICKSDKQFGVFRVSGARSFGVLSGQLPASGFGRCYIPEYFRSNSFAVLTGHYSSEATIPSAENQFRRLQTEVSANLRGCTGSTGFPFHLGCLRLSTSSAQICPMRPKKTEKKGTKVAQRSRHNILQRLTPQSGRNLVYQTAVLGTFCVCFSDLRGKSKTHRSHQILFSRGPQIH